MKIKTKIFMALSIVVLIATGCTSQSTSEPEPGTVTGKVSGGFTATVRELLPDYVADDKTDAVAVVTEFQARPFILGVGKEMASKLEEGESYYFQIKERSVVDIPEAEFKEGSLDTLEAISKYNLEITGFRAPTEKETGDNSPKIIMEKSN